MNDGDNDLFILLQPSQYLQALEFRKCDRFNTLILLGANEKSQLIGLVREDEWDRVIWLAYNGTVLDILRHRREIGVLLATFPHLNEIIVSSYYNEFMNMVINYFPKVSGVLLEDGIANILIDSSAIYLTRKFRVKRYLCKLIGYNVNPISKIKIFTVFEPGSGKIPKIASEVIVNNYNNIRNMLISYEKSKDVYFVSSAFIKCGMIQKKKYLAFLTKLAREYSGHNLNIMLHRFDDLRDFRSLELISNVNVINSLGPIELYFIQKKINPNIVITAGSGATESLKRIYDINIDIIMPALSDFNFEYQKEMKLIATHFQKSHSVKFL